MEASPNARTVESYEAIAAEYARETFRSEVMAGALARLSEVVGAGRVLEIGSGPGWDADRLEDFGLTVRRTDITQAFIDLQRARGKEVDRLDAISDDLDGPYEAVVMLHVLQHIEPKDVPAVLRKVVDALRLGAWFLVSIPRGEGSGWEVGESGLRYYRMLHSKNELLDALRGVGLEPEWADQSVDDDGWLVVMAQRRRSVATD